MTQPLADKVRQLSATYIPLNDERLEKHLKRLDRLQTFYTDKAKIAPKFQGYLFRGFVNALTHSIAILNNYDNLTKELEILTKELDDETRTDSKS